MKRFFALGLALALLALGGVRAQGPDDEYVQIYGLIQEADTLNNTGAFSQAMAKYLQAQTALQRFQAMFPEWNPRIASFRQAYVKDKIVALSARVPVPSAVLAATNRVPGTLPSAVAAPPAAVAPSPEVIALRNQLAALQNQVHALQADKQLLEAKLREALAVQPAAIDPRELARAEERIKALEKENDLLKVSLNQEKAKATPSTVDPKAQAEAQQALSDTLAALRAENAVLKKQVAEAKAAPAAGSKGRSSRQLAEARAQLAALESEREVLRVEKLALENRLKQKDAAAPVGPASVGTNTVTVTRTVTVTNTVALPPAKSEDPARLKALERERDDLQKQLAAATKELSRRKSQATAARVTELENQLAGLKARLDVYEARQVPLTAEELAQFQKAAPKPVEPAAGPAAQAARRMSPQSIALVADAQRHFANRQFDQAEAAYLQVLRSDQTNVVALANLATIQLQTEHLEAAETNILQALALAPEDAYSLSILGYLRYRQHQYDAALDALGRAAQRDPNNAQVQNYLGITLAEKGLRGPAETAFRKAIQIEPNYGDAHVNLAMIYVAQQPPALELARWHYERALNAGHVREPYLDRTLEVKK